MSHRKYDHISVEWSGDWIYCEILFTHFHVSLSACTVTQFIHMDEPTLYMYIICTCTSTVTGISSRQQCNIHVALPMGGAEVICTYSLITIGAYMLTI